MIQTYNIPIEIPILPDPRTGLARKMVDPTITINTTLKEIKVTWHIVTTDLLGGTSVITEVQTADNNSYINLTNQELLSAQQYEDLSEPKPAVMGEYDYWHYANKQQPFPVMQQIAVAGQQFAIRRGYLLPD